MAATKKRNRAPVSKRALIQRVNRKLATEKQTLKTWRRSEMGRYDAGDLYLLDLSYNSILREYVDLDTFARELGVLTDYEELES
jgi:hypothetical protein